MKFSIITLFFLIILSCSDGQNNYRFEDQLYTCIQQKSKEKFNIKVEQIVKKSEQHLLKTRALKTTNGKGYFDLIKDFKKNDFQIPSLPEELSEKLFLIPTKNYNCDNFEFDESNLPLNSRYAKIAIDLSGLFDNIVTVGELNPELILNDILKTFRAEDFNHPLYQLILFKFLAFHKPDKGVLALPSWSEDKPDITKLNERNVYAVLVNKKNELFVRDQPMKIKDLRKNTKEFIANPNNNPEYAEKPSRAIISLKNERGTKFETYLKVLNELKAAYNELRDEKAQELHGKDFEALEKPQQKEIRNMIPIVISEQEPTSFGEE